MFVKIEVETTTSVQWVYLDFVDHVEHKIGIGLRQALLLRC